MALIDISPTISPKLAVWPGDTPVSREVLCDMAGGDHMTLSTLRTTVHAGSHVDAPSHYGADGRTIDEQSLDLYVGRCSVVRVDVQRGSRVSLDQIGTLPSTERLLIATGTYSDPNNFDEGFAALEPDLIDALADAGARLVGVDVPSVDVFSSKNLEAHQRCLARDVAILEGLVLRDVEPGEYELIALPLKLAGFDGSPVRAVLRTL